MIEIYAAALLGVMAAQAAPGPNFMAVAAAALGAGRSPALLVVAGVASGMLLWASGMAFGLGALLSAFPALLTAMKLIGGGYLCWMAARALLAAWRGDAARVAAATARRSPLRWAAHGALVVLTNPKAALMWVAVAAFLFGHGLSPAAVLAFGPLAALSAALIYGGYALLFSTGGARRLHAGARRWIETGFGVIFGAMGATLVLAGLREARA